jgi:hypothetical protein
MTVHILDQVVEYDKTAGAWGRYSFDGELVHYHDSQDDATMAALPEELQGWVKIQADQGRALRAAALIANGEIVADREAYGIYSRKYQHDGYTGHYVIDAKRGTCTCPDFEHHRLMCKHIMAARYLFDQWKRANLAQPICLWDLAQAAIEQHKHEECAEKMEIWRSPDGQRSAYVAPVGEIYLYLFLSGHTTGLLIAAQHHQALPENGSVTRWDWIARQAAYKHWVAAIRNPQPLPDAKF